VADVQERLRALGIDPDGDDCGKYGPSTRAAVEAFQHRRGLRVDGICGRQTWATLVEAGHRLGDRFLYRRTPPLRGDDVAELQRHLSGLGFDPGRVDGIFGPDTSAALAEFQRNVGLPVDAILGAATLVSLQRVRGRHSVPQLASEVRERERLRTVPPTLARRHVAIGEPGGLGTVLTALRRALLLAGARVTALQHPDGSEQARLANSAGADVFVGFRLDPTTAGTTTAYYAGYRYESPGGRQLATVVQEALSRRLNVPDLGIRGMSVPVLRETRMPAVLVEVGPARIVVESGPTLVAAIAAALTRWAGAPLEDAVEPVVPRTV